jgi:replicative DNA helicase
MSSFYEYELYAEKAVLASLMSENKTWDKIGDYLQINDFSSKLHREIYWAIQDLLMNGKNADVICVSQHLVSENRVHDDPFVQVCEIMRSQFAPTNIKYYAEIIKKKSLDRKMVDTAKNIILSVRDQKTDRLSAAQQCMSEIIEEVPSNVLLAADILKSVITSIDERNANQSDITGLGTGFSDLDKITSGLQAGDLIILAGRPSMGKTLLAMNIAEHAALNEKKSVAIFSLEMSKEKLLERSIASVGGIPSDQLRTGNLSENDFKKLTAIVPKFQEASFFIDDRSFLHVADIRAASRRIIHEHGLSLVVVDYIGLMSAEGENETLRVTSISRGLKLLARDLNVPVIAISQLNRAVEYRSNKRPGMADLRQSGSIEQDADLILFIYRDEVYNHNSQQAGKAEIIIAKHRNGEVGTINLNFNSKYCRFDNYKNEAPSKPLSEKVWSGRPLIY